MTPAATPAVAALLAEHGIGGVLEEPLREYVGRQRWFGGKGRGVGTVSIEDVGVVHDGDWTLLFVITRIGDDSGDAPLYHTPLALVTATERPPVDPVQVIAELPADGGETLWVIDGLGHLPSVLELWRAVAESRTVATVHGRVRCSGSEVVLGDEGPEAIRPLGREQSNTSLVRAGRELFKCMRRVEAGTSPELEMTSALRRAGYTHIAPPLGIMEYERDGAEQALLGLIQPYLHNGVEGWALALTSLRDLYADAEEALTLPGQPDALELLPREQGAAFQPEAGRLGEVTAGMHVALADESLPEAVRAVPITAAVLAGWADEMDADLDALLEREDDRLEPLRERHQHLRTAFDAVRRLAPAGLSTRIHGDYHLGQVLRTDAGWTVLDFEGEPARTPEARRRRSSPLRDVAGMLRSFDYAAAAALTERTSPRDPDWDRLMAQGQAWARANRQAFWRAYLRAAEGTPLLPAAEDALTLRTAFELQKAVYEIGYELGHRPDWVAIPLWFLLGELQHT